jgi:hypothetical protein
MKMRTLALPVLLALIYLPPVSAATERPFIDTPEPPAPSSIKEREPWREQEVTLPPWPRDGDLVEFELDEASPFRYYLDGKHLSVGRDGVVRYTLVAESRSGTRNVSYEGLRCTPRGNYRIYAYGINGRFDAAPGENWQGIAGTPGDQVHRELHDHFLCGKLTFEPRPKKDIIRALKGNIHPRANTGFLPD